MPLRDVGAFYEWIARERPSAAARSIVRTFIAGLAVRPWSAPSVPIAELSDQPGFEMRTAVLDVRHEPGIELWWIHHYASGDVDIVAVTKESRPG